jgi:hypothetical protein
MVTVDPELLNDEEEVEYEGAMSFPQEVTVHESEVTHKSLEPVSRFTIVRVGPSWMGTEYSKSELSPSPI